MADVSRLMAYGQAGAQPKALQDAAKDPAPRPGPDEYRRTDNPK